MSDDNEVKTIFEIVYPYPTINLKTGKLTMVYDPKIPRAIEETYDYIYYPILEE